jgi:hypothetical protein
MCFVSLSIVLAPLLVRHVFRAGAPCVMWFGLTYGNILWFPLMQEKVPPDLLGRRLTIMIGGVIAAATGSVMAIPGVREQDKVSKS